MANALQAVLDRAKEKAPEKAPKLERAAAPPRPRKEPIARPEEPAERRREKGLPNPSAPCARANGSWEPISTRSGAPAQNARRRGQHDHPGIAGAGRGPAFREKRKGQDRRPRSQRVGVYEIK